MVLIEAIDGRARDPRGAVLFDFGGTLDADGLRWSVRFHEAYAAGGGRVDAESFESAFRASDRALEVFPGIRTLGFRVMIETQAELLRPLLPDGASMDAPAIAARVHAEAVRMVNRNRPVLDALRPRFRLGVISNFTGNLELCLVELGVRDAFDIVTDSAILGFAKPDPRPFVHTIETLGVPPHSAWMVGDNFEADIRPGHRLGMQTVWLAPADRPLPPGCVPTARIPSLTDLANVIHASPYHDRGASTCTA